MLILTKYSDKQIHDALKTLPKWTYQTGSIHRSFAFKDFIDAFAFMSKVALLSEKANHHPNWSNVYNTVDINLNTHDAGGITEKDFSLATKIDNLI